MGRQDKRCPHHMEKKEDLGFVPSLAAQSSKGPPVAFLTYLLR